VPSLAAELYAVLRMLLAVRIRRTDGAAREDQTHWVQAGGKRERCNITSNYAKCGTAAPSPCGFA